MNRIEREYRARDNLLRYEYKCVYYDTFDYSILSNITNTRSMKKGKKLYSDAIIMLDTETSKVEENSTYTEIKRVKKRKRQITKYNPVNNKVILWTMSIRWQEINIVTLFGRKPSEIMECLKKVRDSLKCDIVPIYVHYLSYDWTFLRQYFFETFAYPVKQLNTQAHYPIYIEFENGIILRDSLILAQRGLGKWAEDLDVEHKKLLGSWNYDKIRTQSTNISKKELSYAEYDTLAGVECLYKTQQALAKNNTNIPWTATGIPREQVQKLAKGNNFKPVFSKIALSYKDYCFFNEMYHGGYVHGNRHYINRTITEAEYGLVKCYDFASSYPYVMIAEKIPMGEFKEIECDANYIINNMHKYAFAFKLIAIKPIIKSDAESMPYLQLSKCDVVLNPLTDNGRILRCEYIEIKYTEYDLALFLSQYDFKELIITDCKFAYKDYLPKWFRDYIFSCFKDKTMLKGGDPVAYSIAKAKLNSLYGMCVQKPVREIIEEDYQSGEFRLKETNLEEEYNLYIKRINSLLPYQWGVWVTAIATYNLFQLGKCCDIWLYSDTDSCYGIDWNLKKVENYNKERIKRIKASGYGCVAYNERDYWLGVAEHEGDKDTYTEFRYQGAKRYAGRCLKDGEIHITVAGVPKKEGAKCLKSLDEFDEGFIFKGTKTGKQLHTYVYHQMDHDIFGDEYADGVDLTPCDYELASTEVWSPEDIFIEDFVIEMHGGELFG